MKREVEITEMEIEGITHIALEPLKQDKRGVKVEGFTYNKKNGKRSYKANKHFKMVTIYKSRELELYLIDIIGRVVQPNKIMVELYTHLVSFSGLWSDERIIKIYLVYSELYTKLTKREYELLSGVLRERYYRGIK